jgi:hypothetical protein
MCRSGGTVTQRVVTAILNPVCEPGHDDPEWAAIREAIASGQSLGYTRTNAARPSGNSQRAGITDDDIKHVEEGGSKPTVPALLPRHHGAQHHRPAHH